MGRAKNYRTSKRKFAGNRYTVQREKHASSDNDVGIATASSSKLESNEELLTSKNDFPNDNESFGNRIIDINTLITVFTMLCCPVCLKQNLKLMEDSRFGLCSNFTLKCNSCSFVHGFSSTKKVNNSNQINTLVVYALRLVGKGYIAGRKLFSMLDLPFLSKVTFRSHELKVLHATSEVFQQSIMDAAKEVKMLKGCIKGTVSCGVSLDGTWQKRGYSSLNGCVSCISIDTGKILDVEVMSQYCRICDKLSKKANNNSHICWNHQGSASSMETVGVYHIFERSETIRKLKYTDYYGDGDSKAYEAVKDIYGEDSVMKLECIGHVQKRVGSRLRKLKKTTKGLGGRGKLTDRFIDTLQNYYGIAIRSNQGDLPGMQSAVIAAFYHCCSSSKFPMHGQCPPGADSWCRYQSSKAVGKSYKEKSCGLPQNIIKIVKQVYIQLCDQSLLNKCLHGKTQNANESFNNVLWNIVPKQTFVELQTVQLGTYIAALQFNEGSKGVFSVLKQLGLSAGSYIIHELKLGDYERINDSKRHSLPNAKLQRKKLSAHRKSKGLKCEEKEGVTYQPGEF